MYDDEQIQVYDQDLNQFFRGQPDNRSQMRPDAYGNPPQMRPAPEEHMLQESYRINQVVPGETTAYGFQGQSAAQSHNPHGANYEFGGPYSSQRSPNGNVMPGNSVADGRGRAYLTQGPALQGSYLNPAIRTATELAIELRIQNQKLGEALSRTQLELDNRMRELDKAREAYVRKEADLTQARNRESMLLSQVEGLKAQLQIANHEKSEIRRQSDEELKVIESTLNELLMNAVSRTGN